MATTAADWAFLEEWFEFLGSLGIGSNGDGLDDIDDVRVGRTARDPSWIQVGLDREQLDFDRNEDGEFSEDDDDEFFGESPDWVVKPDVVARLRLVREAIVLTSIVAQTNYDCWLVMMKQFADFSPVDYSCVPVDGVVPNIPVQFHLCLDTQHNALFLDWANALGHLLGDLQYGDEFQRDLQQAKDVLARRGIAWTSIEPTRFKISYTFHGTQYVSDDVRRRLMRFVTAIQRMHKLEKQASAKGRGTVFQLVELDLDLLRVDLDDNIIKALTSILQAGCRVGYLRLPAIRSDLPSVDAWATFVRLLTGIDLDDEGRLASVRRIEMPATYAGIFHFVPFCSALAFANGVEVVIFAGAKHPDGTDVFGYNDHARAPVWRWLAFALFSKASRSSVQRLILKGERATTSDVACISTIAQSENPLENLAKASVDEEVSSADQLQCLPLPASVVIPRRTVLRLSDGTRMIECQSRCALAGQLIGRHIVSGKACVLIPGYGICTTYDVEEDRSAKGEKLTSAFESLVLKPEDENAISTEALEKLLEVLGLRLRSLRIKFKSNEATLRAVFRLCPNLESLAIERASLPSMQVFDDAYASGLQITSLSLDRMTVPTNAVNAFVRKLADRHPPERSIAATLERLYWGSHWPTRSDRGTIALFRDVHQHNTTLTHINGAYISTSFSGLEELSDCEGQPIPGLSKHDQRRLICLLGAVRRAAILRTQTTSCIAQFDAPIVQRIWSFALTPRHRTMSWVPDFSEGVRVGLGMGPLL